MISRMAWEIGWTLIRALKSLKKYTFLGSFCPKHVMFQQENFIGIMCHWRVMQNLKENWLMTWVISHDTEDWCKVWRNTDSWFQKWHEKFGEF